ncbi:MAG: class I SAM-dependent methyltransferase [Pirellulales bacterium]|nr:class I SAM-dependent methyltransferase [Pirellulales bacterium]
MHYFAEQQYELIDFGAGRKLERFGGVVVDRPCPAADQAPRACPQRWCDAVGHFDRTAGAGWQWQSASPDAWSLCFAVDQGTSVETVAVELRATDAGQVGFFPEQAGNWLSISQYAAVVRRPARVLNLFAYTGASTLVVAACGAEVTHVDAARGAVTWARANAQRSGLAAAPIRWIVDDARAYVARERRRGRSYDLVILDPPSYGHGAGGAAWQLVRDLPDLLAGCWALLAASPQPAMLASCHTQGFTARDLAAWIQPGAPRTARLRAVDLELVTSDGRRLPSGVAVRCICTPSGG